MVEEWRAVAVDEESPADRPVTVPGRPGALAGADAVEYTTTVEDPRGGEDEAALLILNGCYAHTTVEVSGECLAGSWPVKHDTYFEPLRVPFVPEERNEITVTCHAPRDRFGGIHDTDEVPATERVSGIWWRAALETHSLPFIESMTVRPRVTDGGVRLAVEPTVVTDGPLSDRITFSVKPEGGSRGGGMMERAAVETDDAGRVTVSHSIPLRDPARWWPRGLGEQNRYVVRAKLGDEEHRVAAGICEVTRTEDEIRVNGEPLPVRGVTLESGTVADVERAAETNATLVRAHAHVPSPAVYDACDRQGLLVWQDLPLTGPGEFDVERGHAVAGALVEQYARHPSLGPVSVHDEPVTVATGLGTGLLDRWRLRWRAWRAEYDPGAAEQVADALPETRPVFPVVGGPGIDPDAAAYYPGWTYGTATDIETLLERYPAPVVAAYGAASLSDATADGEGLADVAGFDRDTHDRRVTEGLSASQAYQADVLRTITETLRIREVPAISRAVRDTDIAGMGVYAVDGTPKEAQGTLATAFEPVQVFLPDSAPGETEAVVVNDTRRNRSLDLTWEAGGETGTVAVSVGALGRWRGDLALPVDADGVTLTLTLDEGSVTNSYDF